MRIQIVNRVCLVICIVTILIASLIGLLAVWGVIGEDTSLMWRALGTCAVLFFASGLTMTVLNTYLNYARREASPPPRGDA